MRKPVDYIGGHALTGGNLKGLHLGHTFNLADRYIFPCTHLVPHEVLKNDGDFAVEIVEVVFAKIDTVEQNLALERVIKSSQQLHDSGLTLAVFTHESNSFARA